MRLRLSSRTRRAKWSMRGSVTGSDTPSILERDLRGTFLKSGAGEWLRGRSTRLDAEDGATTKRLNNKKARRSGPSTLAPAGQFDLPARGDYSGGDPAEHHIVQHETGQAREVRNGLRRSGLLSSGMTEPVMWWLIVPSGWITNWILHENSQRPVLSDTRHWPPSSLDA